MNKNLTQEQKDYAIFPCYKWFFATFIGKQRREEYVERSLSQHANFTNDVESMNWLNPIKDCLIIIGVYIVQDTQNLM